MLDEGLEILTKLWTATPVSYSGKYYTLDHAQFLPAPLQLPRIPLWIAGVWPGTRPFRRAARWDGVFPTGRYGDLTPEQIREMIAYIETYRTKPASFDVVVGGRMHEKPAEAAELLTQYASVGVTWWLESFWPDTELNYVRSVIRRGPPPYHD
jgi:alkanesulfonate monooxygenase SsuD/methylene tetrahydromethanopterin reductase-like flavin-dependent oxidoreductase (luciferase family)